MVSSKLVGLAVPFLFKRAIDVLMTVSQGAATGVVVAGSLKVAIWAILAHGLARVFASASHEMRNSVFAKAGQRIGRSITATSFAHIHSLEAAFHNASRTGALTRIVDRGTRSVLTIFRGLLFAFTPSLFELVLVCAVLLKTFSAWYAGVTLVTFIGFVAWTLFINDELGRLRSELNSVENEASAKLTDSLINVEAVKAFDNADFELERYDESLRHYERVAIRNEWLYASLNIGQGAIFTGGLTLMLFRAATAVVGGSLTVGSIVMLSTMLQQLWVPLNFLGWQYREVKQSLIDVQNLFEILERPSRIVDAPNAKELVVTGGRIAFENVSFIYPEMEDGFSYVKTKKKNGAAKRPRQKALDRVSFHVGEGTSLAIVGSSGSGKSTATRLLYRLYDLSGGRITIDDQDISEATLASLRLAVSIVPQDTALFNGTSNSLTYVLTNSVAGILTCLFFSFALTDTIAYNIRYGRPDATDEEVIAAAKAASVHEVIMRTEQGYDTVVGERGVRLSGGERQRLSVARAFLKGSRIIIEDESTSALDTLTEMEVSKALEKLGVNRTRIIVAHRLSTIMDVDNIVVMKDGQVVEEGAFEDLLERSSGVFKGMWERQQKRDEGDEEEMRVRTDHMRGNGVFEQRRELEGDLLRGEMT